MDLSESISTFPSSSSAATTSQTQSISPWAKPSCFMAPTVSAHSLASSRPSTLAHLVVAESILYDAAPPLSCRFASSSGVAPLSSW